VQTNIYAQKENGDLRLIAEIEGLNDPALAVDALLDEMPRLKQREFVVIDLDNVMIVEAGEDVVQPRREIVIRNGTTPTPKRRGRPPKAAAVEPEEDDENGEEEEEAPAPAPKRSRAAKSGGKKASPFRSNPKSAD
jgi:hypothetical protein